MGKSNKQCVFDDDGKFLYANRFNFFKSYFETMQYIPEEHQLTYLKMIIEYGLYNIEPDENVPLEVRCHFPQIKAIVDSGRESSLNGAKGVEAKTAGKAMGENIFNDTLKGGLSNE